MNPIKLLGFDYENNIFIELNLINTNESITCFVPLKKSNYILECLIMYVSLPGVLNMYFEVGAVFPSLGFGFSWLKEMPQGEERSGPVIFQMC